MNLAAIRKDVIVVVAILLALFGVTHCSKLTKHEANFTIVYSNDVLGETEPCG
ncbi:MAG: hypothetical protein JW984_03485 [Deltaproteobacteria bacterium]|uniref:Uncharacterized protein n=1 Tax=Candidatus Zymogenus saltonus TaxID=2844893 RepID=A0A9D8KCX5_9DELT|nr:hypothetical protein [Candidatus Zymogenus saltonus]